MTTINRTSNRRPAHFQLVSFWGSEGNSFANSATCNNGGGYRQPYGGALWFVPGTGDVLVTYNDDSCGDFGCRWDAQIEVCATGQQWLLSADQMRNYDEQQDERRWNRAAHYGIAHATGINAAAIVKATREAVNVAAYKLGAGVYVA